MKVRHYFTSVVGVIAVAALIHYSSLDGIHGAVLARVLGTDTRYAGGYTTRGFRTVRTGMTELQVRQLLGQPLGETWRYETAGACDVVYVRGAEVERPEVEPIANDGCRAKGITAHMPMSEVVKLLGPPRHVAWRYTESPTSTHYRERIIFFENGRVSQIRAALYLD